jgi:hypothetical protein
LEQGNLMFHVKHWAFQNNEGMLSTSMKQPNKKEGLKELELSLWVKSYLLPIRKGV